MAMSISVVIVTYNAERYIISCLRSILGSRNVVIVRVVVVDNASSDDTLDIVERHFGSDPRVQVVRLRRNVGFPLACNIGAAHVDTEFVVFMNPDVMVSPYCFANLASYMSCDETIAVAQPKILHPGGYIDSAGGLVDLLGHGFHMGKFEKDHGQYNEPRDVLYACFACTMVRRDVYLRLGGMDSYFFLYNEDLDYCWRCWLAGYRVVYVPNAVAYHVGGHSVRKVPYHALYFSRRNRLITVLSNYALPLALLSFAILLLMYMLAIPYHILKGRKLEARIFIKILANVVKYVNVAMRKRKIVHKIRKIGDLVLIRKKFIKLKPIGVILHLLKHYEVQLGLKGQK